MQELLNFYSGDGSERVGFVLHDGTAVEVDNVSDEPHQGFVVSTEDLLKYELSARATWHTHPGSSSNLSVEDSVAFKSWPQLEHYVIGSDGIRHFKVDGGVVVVA